MGLFPTLPDTLQTPPSGGHGAQPAPGAVVAEMEGMLRQLLGAGIEIVGSSPAEMDAYFREEREHEGKVYEVLFWDYDEGGRTYTIWGATARTLRSFLDLMA